MTLMACTEAGVMTQEGAYLEALQEVDSLNLTGDVLVLSGPGGELVFGQ